MEREQGEGIERRRRVTRGGLEKEGEEEESKKKIWLVGWFLNVLVNN